MSKNIKKFITGIYLAISTSVIGYLYINPVSDSYNYKINGKVETYYIIDHDYFKYSILISIVGFILLISFFQLWKNDKK